jgi:uncharacterized membrane protein
MKSQDILLFVKILIIVLCFDGIYFYLMRSFLLSQISQVQKSALQIRYPAVIACYFIIASTIFYMIKTGHSAFSGGILGFVIYSIYELTNYSILSAWKPTMVILDTLWGSFLFGATMIISRFV